MALLKEKQRVTIHDESRPWTIKDNKGGAMSPRQAAFLWSLPSRTVQRWAESGVIPDTYTRGKRLLIRRTRASFEWLQRRKSFDSGRKVRKHLRDPKSPINSPEYLNQRFAYSWAESFGGFDKWKASALSDAEKSIYKMNPARFGLVAVAAMLLQEKKRFSVQAVVDRIKNTRDLLGNDPRVKFRVSRSYIYRHFHSSASAELKIRGAALLSTIDPKKKFLGEIECGSGGSLGVSTGGYLPPSSDEMDERLGWSN
jgi:hypothetical protein